MVIFGSFMENVSAQGGICVGELRIGEYNGQTFGYSTAVRDDTNTMNTASRQ